MHELALCEGLLGLIESERATHGFARVDRVCLAVGAYANVEVEALRLGFEAVTRGTAAEGAVLELHCVPARVWCLPCAAQREVSDHVDGCPVCGSAQLMPQEGGTELRLASLEVH